MPLRRGIEIGGLSGLAPIIIVLIIMLFGVDPSYLLQGLQGVNETQTLNASAPQTNGPIVHDDQRDVVAMVLSETEEVWYETFRNREQSYRPPPS